MKNKHEQLSKRVEKLRTLSQQWNSYLGDIYEYSMPNRNTFTNFTPGQKKDNQIFDSTAVIAVNNYVSRIQSLLVKPWTPWFALQAGTDIPDEARKDINTELDLVSKTIFNELNYSNFSEQISSSFFDLAASTGILMIREDTRPGSPSNLVFESIPLASVMLDTASDGDVKTIFRDIKVPVEQIQAKWPNAELTAELKDTLRDNPDTIVDLTEGVLYQEQTMDYNFVLFEKGNEGNSQEKSFLIDTVIEESPFIVFRENVTPGETYGRGRLMSVYGDIRSANKIMELTLSAAAMSIAGVYTAVSDGVFNVNTARFKPGSVIPVSSNGANPTLAPLSNASDINVANFELTALRSNINTVLLTMPLGDVNEVKGRTATEMSIRQNDFLETSMSGFNRLQTELLNKIITKVMFILKKSGKIEDIEANGKEVKVVYISPIAQMAQDEQLNKTRMFMEMMAAMPEQVSNMMVNYNVIPQDILDQLDLPEKYIRSQEEIAQIGQALQAQEAQQQAPRQ